MFHNLLGLDGLLRRLNTTVLVASSSGEQAYSTVPVLFVFLLMESAAKRLPYADHILSLDSTGKITEQGTFEKLDAAGGYVSNFNLPPADWTYVPDQESLINKHSIIDSVSPSVESLKATEVIEDEASRRIGDFSIYLYYVKSIGWMPTMIFVVAITAYIFCMSFPSKSFRSITLLSAGLPY